jgi:hypothetical protein
VARRKRKRRGRGTLILIAIALLIAGFVVRRTLLPQFLHYLAYRPSDTRTPSAQTTLAPVVEAPLRSEPSAAAIATPAGRRTKPPPSEDLTAQDREQLQEILKHKGR